jgi:hypothetical protein
MIGSAYIGNSPAAGLSAAILDTEELRALRVHRCGSLPHAHEYKRSRDREAVRAIASLPNPIDDDVIRSLLLHAFACKESSPS